MKPIKSPETLATYAALFRECQACGIPEGPARSLRWPGLAIHHLIRMGRSDDRTNLLRLCQRCHDAVHVGTVRDFPALSLGILLTVKMTRDPAGWDPERLKELHISNLPPRLDIPDVLMHEWNQWQGPVRKYVDDEPPF